MYWILYSHVTFSSVLPFRFCPGYRAGDLLQDRTLHTPVLLLLRGHCGLPAGHDGRGDAHLEHSTPSRWLSRTTGYNHQPLLGVTLPPAPWQWLRGVALLSRRDRATLAYGTSEAQHLKYFQLQTPSHSLCCGENPFFSRVSAQLNYHILQL